MAAYSSVEPHKNVIAAVYNISDIIICAVTGNFIIRVRGTKGQRKFSTKMSPMAGEVQSSP